ncbi:MAG: ATP synthase subunit I [Desulfobacterales bacterium]
MIKTETTGIRELQKKVGTRALTIALVVAGICIAVGARPIGKGLLLGTLFSILNFVLMAATLPMRLQPTRRRAFWGALGGMLPRYLLLAVPVFLALKLDQLNLWATVGGMFMVQAIILLEPLWRSLRAARQSQV